MMDEKQTRFLREELDRVSRERMTLRDKLKEIILVLEHPGSPWKDTPNAAASHVLEKAKTVLDETAGPGER